MTGCVICTQLLAGTRRRLPAISDISPYQQPGSSCSNPRGLAPARMQMSWGPAGTFLFLKGTLSPKQLRTSIVGSPYWRKLGPGKCREKEAPGLRREAWFSTFQEVRNLLFNLIREVCSWGCFSAQQWNTAFLLSPWLPAISESPSSSHQWEDSIVFLLLPYGCRFPAP